MKKNKKLTAEMRALEKQRKAEQYRERELAKTEAEALEVTVKVEQPKESNPLKKEKRKMLKEKRKQRKEKRKRLKTPVEPTPVEKPVDTPIIESAPIFNTPVTPPSTPVAEPKPPIDVKPPKPTRATWDAKEILEMMESVEKGLEDLKKQIEDDGITDYKGGSKNRYVEAANAVYDNIGSAQTKLKRAKAIIDRFTELNLPLDDDTVGEKALAEINEQWTVLSEWKEVMVYSLYEADEANKTIIGTGLDAMEEKVTDLDDLASAIDKIGYSISRGARSQGLKI